MTDFWSVEVWRGNRRWQTARVDSEAACRAQFYLMKLHVPHRRFRLLDARGGTVEEHNAPTRPARRP